MASEGNVAFTLPWIKDSMSSSKQNLAWCNSSSSGLVGKKTHSPKSTALLSATVRGLPTARKTCRGLLVHKPRAKGNNQLLTSIWKSKFPMLKSSTSRTGSTLTSALKPHSILQFHLYLAWFYVGVHVRGFLCDLYINVGGCCFSRAWSFCHCLQAFRMKTTWFPSSRISIQRATG